MAVSVSRVMCLASPILGRQHVRGHGSLTAWRGCMVKPAAKIVLIDGPSTVNGVKRHLFPLKRLSITNLKCSISPGAKLTSVLKVRAPGRRAGWGGGEGGAEGQVSGSRDERTRQREG